MVIFWMLLACGGWDDDWCLRLNLDCAPEAASRAPVVDNDLDAWSPPEDCNDLDPEIRPGAAESCDNIDNNCDGQRDEGLPRLAWYPDADGDNYGDDSAIPRELCWDPGSGWTQLLGDCDDTNPAIAPSRREDCDGVDNDCDGEIDESGQDAVLLYPDADGDGYGDSAQGGVQCPAAGLVPQGGDCDDRDSASSPGAEERYDGLDNSCDGYVDVVWQYSGWHLDGVATSFAHLGTLEGGRTDALALAYYADNKGSVDVITGTKTGIRSVRITGEVGARAGAALHGVGDADGDGFADFMIGDDLLDTAANNAGGVYLLYGPSVVSQTSSAEVLLLGESASSYTGSALGSGDLDGDGAVELLVGAYKEGAGGTVWLVQGPVTAGTYALSARSAARLEGASAGDAFGRALAGVGDVDGDGLDDLVVGAHGADQAGDAAGAAYLYLDGGETLAATFLGEEAAAAAGFAVAGVGDVDGDGLADVVVGAHNTVRGTAQVGVAYLIAGRSAWTAAGPLALDDAALAWVEGSAQGALLGYRVSGLGDVDGDGLADVGVGAPGADVLAADGGLQHVVPGWALRDGGVVGTLAYGTRIESAGQGSVPLLAADLGAGLQLVLVAPQAEVLYQASWPD